MIIINIQHKSDPTNTHRHKYDHDCHPDADPDNYVNDCDDDCDDDNEDCLHFYENDYPRDCFQKEPFSS